MKAGNNGNKRRWFVFWTKRGRTVWEVESDGKKSDTKEDKSDRGQGDGKRGK